MSREQIIQIAREAGIDEWWNSGSDWRETFDEALERFAAAIRLATKDEDAKICEEIGKPNSFQSIAESIHTEITSSQIASAIRASK